MADTAPAEPQGYALYGTFVATAPVAGSVTSMELAAKHCPPFDCTSENS